MWTGLSKQLLTLKLPDCEVLCPLSKYEAIMKPYIPSSSDKKCLLLENEY